MWYVYILKCSDSSYYTGVTNDIDKRLKKHNAGGASGYTKTRRPVELQYFEKLADKKLALKRELEIKKWGAKNKKNLIQHGLGNKIPSSQQLMNQ